jgi:acetyl-CoA acetyltransferase
MKTYVLNLAIHPPATYIGGKRLEELVFDVTHQALAAAGVEREEVDNVTIAGCDELDGRSISSMLLAMPAGAYMKDEIKCTDTGLYGLILGALRIESGLHDIGLVVSWNKSSTAPFEDVMLMRCDPFFVRPVGLNASIADGFFARAMAEKFGIGEDEANEATLRAYANAARNTRSVQRGVPTPAAIADSPYVSVPLRQGHQAPLTDGAVAMVLVSERWLARHPKYQPMAKLAGFGWRTDGYNLGADRLSNLRSFHRCIEDASNRAGLNSLDDVDVLEFDCQTGYHAAAYSHALGLAGDARVGPSGGAFAQNPYFCTGLVNAAEAVLQVSGTAGAVQVPGARRALAHASHGFAQQANGAAIFERAN